MAQDMMAVLQLGTIYTNGTKEQEQDNKLIC